MAKFLHGKGTANSWFKVNEPGKPVGVLLRQSNGNYIAEPQDISTTLVQTVSELRLPVVFAIATESTEAIFDVISDEDHEVMLSDGLHIQVFHSMDDLVGNELSLEGRDPYAALIKNERILLIWQDDVDKALQQCARVPSASKLYGTRAQYGTSRNVARAVCAQKPFAGSLRPSLGQESVFSLH